MIIVLIVAVVLLAVSIAPSLSFRRQRKIELILRDLRAIPARAGDDDFKYAVEQNIEFFKSIRTIPEYIAWGITRRNRIDGSRLLEIADLLLPRWEKELFQDLAHVERKDFPGLSKPLRNLLLRYILDESYTYFLDLGCGGMEVERQALLELGVKANHPVVFVGVDYAPQAWESIRGTFKDTPFTVHRLTSIDELGKWKVTHPMVFFLCGDALQIAKDHGKMFNIVFSSRFRHHLSDVNKNELDRLSVGLDCPVIEYDDYRTIFSWLVPLLTAWYRPVLLNGAIFSQLRQPTKRDLLKSRRSRELSGAKIRIFSPPGSYAKVYKDNLG